MVRNFNTPLSVKDRTRRENINKNVIKLNGTISNLVYWTFIEYSTQQKNNMQFFQLHVEYLPR